VLLDDARCNHVTVYECPCATVVAFEPRDVGSALSAIESHLAAGRHAAGYFSYELGYALEPRLTPLLWPDRKAPLLWFGIFGSCREATGQDAADLLASPRRAYAGPLAHEWDCGAHRGRFKTIHALIRSGDAYQVNLTHRARFAFAGDAFALYASLRNAAQATHCAYVDDGSRQILSLSPEQFFELSADGAIVARPMKGTAARFADMRADAAARAALADSTKDRAENLMIVDLLRNDLGRIAEKGSVRVDGLYEIETYPTTHQMVSTIRARLRPRTSVTEIVHALFPCGSVTGAPKIRAMEIIRACESSPRGVYCGAVGAFAPDGSARFNVAIRTLTIDGDGGELGIGGAIVYDSRPQDEYAEALLKAQYYESVRRPIELVETLRHVPAAGFVRLERHLARMAQSAERFGLTFDRSRALESLQSVSQNGDCDLRVRLSLDEQNRFACSAVPLAPGPSAPWRYAVSPIAVASDDPFLRHKTDWRDVYDGEYARAMREEAADEIILLNEHGEVTEGSRTNVFVRRNGLLLTPPLDAGVLNGCLRQELFAQGACVEHRLVPQDLARADAVYLGNSLRGLVPAISVSGVGT
jgi:para-aminobenzoate synthetase/4-amino-4-deoxychorismate lyase